MKHRLILFTALAGLLAAGLTQAAGFTQFQPDKSRLAFVYKQMNVPMEGRFTRFTGRLAFDPARPATARAELDIDLASIDAGYPEANAEVAGRLWLNTPAYPRARFVSSALKPLGNNRYQVTGQMTLKGRTREVSAPATFRQEGGNAVFEGGFVLRRADFAIGEGMWADFNTVANEIQITFRLVAAPAPGTK